MKIIKIKEKKGQSVDVNGRSSTDYNLYIDT